MLTIKKELPSDTELHIALEGRLDTLAAPELEEALEKELPNITSLVLDFRELEYISSAGLRILLTAQQYMEENEYPDVQVINANNDIRETFEFTGFDKVLDIR